MRTLILALALGGPLGLLACSAIDGGPAPAGPAALAAALPATLFEETLGAISGPDRRVADSFAADRPIVLVFWQSWCSSCVAEAPELARAAREHPEFDFYGIVSGPEGRVDELAVGVLAAELELPYPNLRDTSLALTEGLGVTGTPTIVVLGPDRRVRYDGHEPPADWAALR